MTQPNDYIFVFGSNLSGIHGAGAALYAKKHYGAVQGVGEGRTGNSYALPTKGPSLSYIGPSEIQFHVDDFISYAETNPDLKFKVTQVGCGLAGFRSQEIADLFHDNIPDNCYFDTAWKPYLPEYAKFWGTG